MGETHFRSIKISFTPVVLGPNQHSITPVTVLEQSIKTPCFRARNEIMVCFEEAMKVQSK